jgi:hypothetical protein
LAVVRGMVSTLLKVTSLALKNSAKRTTKQSLSILPAKVIDTWDASQVASSNYFVSNRDLWPNLLTSALCLKAELLVPGSISSIRCAEERSRG